VALSSFARRVEAAQHELDILWQYMDLEPALKQPLQQVVEGFTALMEEIHVAQEELQIQNEELQAAHQAAETERRRYQDLFDLAPDGYVVTNLGGIIEEANYAAGELLNIRRELLVGRPLAAFVYSREQTTFSSLLSRLTTDPESQGQEWELSLQPWARAPFPAALTASPARDAAGRVIRLRWLLRDVTAAKRAEERERLLVQISQDRQAIRELADEAQHQADELKAILWAMTDAVVVYNVDGTVIQANPAAARAYGLAPAETVRSMNISRFLRHATRQWEQEAGGAPLVQELTKRYPDGRPVIADDLPSTRSLRGETVDNELYYLTTASGEERAVLVSTTPLIHEGQISGAVLVWHDITERQQIERDRDRLIAILESTPDMVSTASVEGRLLYLNQAARRILGIPDGADLATRTIPAGHPEWAHDIIQNKAIPTARREGMWQGETAVLSHNGREIPMSEVIIAHKGAEGKVEYLSTIARDVSELRRLVEENRSQREFMERLVEVAPVGIAVVRGADHHYELVNAAYQKMAGLSGLSIAGRTIEELLSPLVAAKVLDQINRVYESGQVVSLHEVQIPAGPAQEQSYWNIDHVPLRNSEGQIDSVLIIAHDISVQVATHRQVERLALQDQAILASMSEGLIVFDLEGNILSMNPAGLRMHQFTGVEEARRHLREYPDLFQARTMAGQLLPLEDWPATRMMGGEDFTGYELTVQRTDTGHTFTASYSGSGVLDQEGRRILGLLTLHDITSQKAAEAERERLMGQLEAEQSRMKAIIKNAPEAIVVVDRQGRIVLANPAADRIFGQPLPYGQKFETHITLALCDPEGKPYDPRHLPLTRSALEGQAFQNVEMSVCGASDLPRALLVSSAPIRDRRGNITGAVGIFQDITERQRTQLALARQADRLRVLHDSDQAILTAQSPDDIAEGVLQHIWQLVPCLRAGVVLFTLEAGQAELLAVQAGDLTRLGKGWQGQIRAEWPIDALKTGQVYTIEDVLGLPMSAEVRQVLEEEGIRTLMNVPLIAQGELIGALSMGMAQPHNLTAEQMDIVQEMAAELAIGIQQNRLHEQVRRHAQDLEQQVAQRTAALQASEARLRAILDGSAVGIALSDMEGRIVESNPALQIMLGYNGDELLGRDLANLTSPEDAAIDLALFEELVGGQRDQYTAEKHYACKDGRIIWGNVTVSLVKGEGGKPLYVISLIEDVTERKKMQEALLSAEKLAVAGRMGASLAHEINNPLQSVIGCLGLVEKSMAEGGDPGRYLSVARQELRRAASIVTQLRDMSRLSHQTRKEPLDVNAVADEVLILTRKQAQEKRVEVVWAPAENLPAVRGVADRIRQVFLNLVLNALDAMPEGGQLRVSTAQTEQPDGVAVAFADTGVGIAPERLGNLFDPFYTTKSQGLGLGLYITHNVVEEHGGHIDVSSHVGQGTIFTVWLPARSGSAEQDKNRPDLRLDEKEKKKWQMQ
jgi:two-component system NtrC family sensor kinase